MNKPFSILLLLLLLFHGTEATPQVYSLDDGDSVLGSVTTYTLKTGESLIEVAREFDLAYNEIAAANPGLDPFIPDTKSLSCGKPS